MIKTILIDDEKKSVQTLAIMLNEFCTDIEIVATAGSAADGIKEILKHSPDLVFLDIEMTGGSGFDLLESLTEQNFKVVFVTAHDHYAIKAIKAHAIDYILKPLSVEELINAVNNYKHQLTISPDNQINKIETLLKHIKQQHIKKIALPTSTGTEFIAINEIMYLSAERSYCIIYLENKKKIMVSKSMNEIEELIDSHNFFRIHKSNTVNLAFVKKHLKTDGGIIELTDGTKLYLSRLKKDEFSLAMHNFISQMNFS
jgi:two-component system, LytTR family, response regulator